MSGDLPPVLKGRPRDPRRERFAAVLAEHGGNLKRTARALGVSRTTAGKWRRELAAGTLTDPGPTR